MLTLEVIEAKFGGNCVACGSRWRTCEKFLQVKQNGKTVKGERYCVHCEKLAHMNNPGIVKPTSADGGEDRRTPAMARTVEMV